MSTGNDRLTEKVRRFRRLSAEDRSLVLLAMVLTPWTALGLRIVGFSRWRELVERLFLPVRPVGPSESGAQLELAQRITRAVRSAGLHGPVHPNCLQRSMVLWWLLRRVGIDGELHIGARKTESRFEAHAWVELAGQVLNDSADVHTHYARFDAPIIAAAADSGSADKAAV